MYAKKLNVGAVLLAIAIDWFLGKLWLRLREFAHRFLGTRENSSDEEQWWALNLFLNLSFLLVRAIVWVAVALYIANLFPLTRRWSYRLGKTLIISFISPVISVGKNSYSVVDFLILIGLLLGLVILAGTLTNLLRSRVLQITRINRGLQEAIAIVSKYTFVCIGTVVLLQVWGLDLSSLTIVASAIGVAIGFGFQDIAKNFGSGLVLLFERPIQVGDFIEVGNYTGNVELIGARSTLIRTLDQVSIIVPNSRFLENEVINWSHLNPVSRLHLSVGVSYNSDVNLVREALLEAASDCSDILPKPKPQVLFKGFGDSAIDFELLVWINKPSQQIVLKSEMYFRIEASLRKHQIEIPFPQRDLHIRSGNLPLELSNKLAQTLFEISQKLIKGEQNPSNHDHEKNI
ncbi:MAG: mechanosensitive ion channel [Moorea sp. SIO2B7]|nr:mechanosensitive ion channel [Moorena sp. SIO2B7]